MQGRVIRFADFERKSREPDAQHEERDPDDTASIIILPVIRIERAEKPRRRKR